MIYKKTLWHRFQLMIRYKFKHDIYFSPNQFTPIWNNICEIAESAWNILICLLYWAFLFPIQLVLYPAFSFYHAIQKNITDEQLVRMQWILENQERWRMDGCQFRQDSYNECMKICQENNIETAESKRNLA